MQVEHVPTSAWSWRASALIFVLVAAPQVALLGVAPELRSVSVAAHVGGLVIYLAVLLAALLVYVQHRLTDSRITGWLTLCFALVSIQGLVWECLWLAAPGRTAAAVPLVGLVDLTYCLGILVVLALAQRLPLRWDPLAVGVVIGIAIGAVRLVLVVVVPRLEPGLDTAGLLDLSLFSLHCGLAWRLLALADLPTWVAWRLSSSVLALSIGVMLSNHAPVTWLSIATLLLYPLGAVLLCSASLGWLRETIHVNQVTLEHLSDRLLSVEAGHLADRERLHEINGTIAGIASASRLMSQNPSMPEEHAEGLRRMVDSEVSRLERLMQGRAPEPLRPVELDETVRHLVTAQQALGRTVYWRPSSDVVSGHPDDIAEVLNILLNNAARHAPDSPIAITVDHDRETVLVKVTDWGPGVSDELRDRIFEQDEHRDGSPGEGIGLAVARRLMSEQAGFVDLVDTCDRGATFVMGLQAWKGADDPAVAR